MKKKLFVVCLVFLFGITLKANDDKKLLDAILKYNYGIIKMGISGETKFFKEFVEEAPAIKLQVWFESWKFSNLTYIANINDLRFSRVSYNDENATITTQENWTYSYVNLATRDVALEPVTMFYEMMYTFKKHGKKWMIADVKHIKEHKFEKNTIHKPTIEVKEEKPKVDTSL